MAGEDFVQVKMSAAGEKYAGEHGVIRICEGNAHFLFKKGESQRVTKAYEWNKILAPKRAGDEPMFELATDEAPQAEGK